MFANKKMLFFFIILVAVFGIFTGRYNTLQSLDENVTASASETINQYQRRADLIPNLVNTVKGYTQHEQTLLIQITEARAKVGAVHIDATTLSDETKLEQYMKAQSELGSALSRLLVAVEAYPDLKASSLYQDLLAQLEGTENRITVARGRYITAVREYNIAIRRFPDVLIARALDYSAKPNFTVDNQDALTKAPNVEF